MYKVFMLLGLVVVNAVIYSIPTTHAFTVSFLDVGQGDAALIEGPTGVQVLVDGGASRGVLRELARELPLFDRSLDAVVATHPDADHVGGLVDVVARYDVGTYVESGNVSDTPAYQALERELSNENPARVSARAGTRLVLGGGAYADILFPDRDVSGVESNTASIIMRVVYGDTAFMLTGDSPASIEKYLVSKGTPLTSDVLKAGHHGSKTSSDESFIKAVGPDYVVFSRGCDNRYGHPAVEIVERFKALSIPTLDTCTSGTIRFTSDGHSLRF